MKTMLIKVYLKFRFHNNDNLHNNFFNKDILQIYGIYICAQLKLII